MGCSKPGVTVAINALIEKGYVERKTHGNFCLTPKGTKLVNKIRNRYLFFQKILLEAGIERKQAEKEACMLEHVLSEESFNKLKVYIEKEKCENNA